MALSSIDLTFSPILQAFQLVLIYLVNDARTYGAWPLPVQIRRGWEFQAVVQGSIGLLHEEGPDILRSNHLWLSAPSFPHGWKGEKGKSARVIVFHFLFVPKVIENLFRSTGCVELPLTGAQCRRLSELADQAAPYWERPSIGSTLCFEHILLELCMLVLDHHKQTCANTFLEQSEQRVNAAIRWFTERIAENPGLEETSRAIGTSPSNLRRVFQEVLQTSPKQIFDQLRFQRAMQLMSDPQIKLEDVGEACGFGSASSFSRAFKIKFGCSPELWRGSH